MSASAAPSPLPRREKFQTLGLAALSGVLYFLGFIHFGLWPLAFVCFVPLLFALERVPNAKWAFLTSWCMGTSTFLGGYYWLVHLFKTFAEFPLIACLPLFLLFCALQGLQFAVMGLSLWAVRKESGVGSGWLLPPVIAAGECFLPLFFPSYLANSFAFVPALIQTADIGGLAMISFMAAGVSGALFELIAFALSCRGKGPRRPSPLAIVLASVSLVAFSLFYAHTRIAQIDRRDSAFPHVRTAIIQGNVGASAKHLDVEAGIEEFRGLTRNLLRERNDIGLIVWPESAFNKILRGRVNLTGHLADSVRIPMVVGVLREEMTYSRRRGFKSNYFNTVISVSEGGNIVSLYDKVRLVAFGEYLPGEKWLSPLYEILPFSESFTHGKNFSPLALGTWRLSANICYEDILADHVRALMAPNIAGKTPHAMINVTNDSWYGSEEPKIHLALALFRSVEHRRWLVRATATGISAFVDSAGRVVSRTGLDEKAVIVADVPFIEGSPTFYGRFGEWLPALCLAFLFLTGFVPLSLRLIRRRRVKKSS